MSDLVDFLRARLFEDERVALAANTEGASPWFIVGESPGGDDDVYLDTSTRRASSLGGYTVTIGMTCGCCGRGAIAVPFARHFAHFDASRALSEVKAKRLLINDAVRILATAPTKAYEFDEAQDMARAEVWRTVLRALAAPYADRPGYRAEWAFDEG